MRRWIGLVTMSIGRGGALFLGSFLLLGVIGELRGRQTAAELWVVDVRDLPGVVRILGLATFAALLVWWSASAAPRRRLVRATAIACLVVAALAVRDAIRFVGLGPAAGVRPSMPLPLSAVIAGILIGLAVVVARSRRDAGSHVPERPGRRWLAGGWLGVIATAIAWGVAFPVAQIGFFGTTDYRRPADAAVVFGARVYADGSPSPLLADRIATAIELYRDGLVPTLIVSGGTGADGWNEAEVMQRIARAQGVAPDDVVVDRVGVTTEATVANTMTWLNREGSAVVGAKARVIAVSQAYHLPRIQLAFAAAGIDVVTVPAVDPVPISDTPLLVAREIPAFWTYYLRQCVL